MGRPKELTDAVRRAFNLPKKWDDKLKFLAERNKTGVSDLIRRALMSEYGPFDETHEFDINKANKAALNILDTMLVQLAGGNLPSIRLTQGVLMSVTDLKSWQAIAGHLDIVREMLEAKGIYAVVEDNTSATKREGGGAAKLHHEAFTIHAPSSEEPFTKREIQDARDRTETELRTIGRFQPDV